MDRRSTFVRAFCVALGCLVLVACGDDGGSSDDGGMRPSTEAGGGDGAMEGAAPDAPSGPFCREDSQCTPAAGAAACAITFCDRVFLRCTTTGPDADADGHADAACDPGAGEGAVRGDDCDDTDPARFPGRPEICDPTGHDEDCDTTTVSGPDGDVDGDGSFAMTCCNRDDATGEILCGADCNDADATVRPSATDGPSVACDGVDNDCDLETDEGCACRDGQTRRCGSDVGECLPGTETCASGAWSMCSGAVEPTPEDCDGDDDDCNSVVDDGCGCVDGMARPCGMDEGVCAAGVQRCEGGVWSSVCEGSVGPALEACDGDDDDCDGVVDNGCDCRDGDTRPCGTDVGSCVTGTERCMDGRWGVCMGSVGPAPEACDGDDDDCDGNIDNGCDCREGDSRPCGSDVGECVAGTERCTAGRWGLCTGGVGATAEVCDGDDDDCNSVPDDGCGCTNGATRPCPPPATETGDCVAGTQTCSSGAWGACTGGVGPMPEVCEGSHDEDCDGAADEGCGCIAGMTRACPGGIDTGACNAGMQTCSAAGTWGMCVGGIGPMPEVCGNATDEDCDGSTANGCAIVQLTAGYEHTCGLRQNQTVVCWGRNGFGQLGDGTTTDRNIPVSVGGLTDATAIAAGRRHTCALRSTGVMVCWGSGVSGELGTGTLGAGVMSLTPTMVPGLSGVAEIDARESKSCARLSSGALWCWGFWGSGVGNGTTGANHASPVMVTISGVRQVSLGDEHACALTSSAAYCWGRNDLGQLGDGTTMSPRFTPVVVGGLTSAIRIAAGATHSCATRGGGGVSCWGANYTGQLGIGSSGPTMYWPAPLEVMSLTDANGISLGYFGYGCAQRATGNVACWGDNSAGQLGDGTTMQRTIPTAVPSLSVTTLSATGYAHVCAVRTDGRVVCWGLNSYGQLGNGTSGVGTFSSVPTLVSSLP
ncbi:MAG: hypothetical protein IT379_32840 [Deltaproteobacteria bacterium]|nr:hypothetical protein [Deltaproteobacteria bacterium]